MPAAAIDPAPLVTRPVTRPVTRLRGLYAVTPDLDDTRELVARVQAAIDGGAQAIQYRNKSATARTRSEQALALANACRGRALFIVNDDAALAAHVGADGVHVGEGDGDVAIARRYVGAGAIVGVSCYDDLALANARASEGADYVAFGSFFASHVKPAARRADVALLGGARALGLPVVAIGGITSANAAPLFAAGADAVAVISDVFAHPRIGDVTVAARRLVDAWRASQAAGSPRSVA
ncbi:MAG: thiamine phosphate synthase [Betaproteobacteria bacterium]